MQGKYCFLEPEFPQYAFICTLIFNKEDKIRGPFFLNQIYTNLKELGTEVKKIAGDLAKKPGWHVEENVLITEITYERQYPLKREYWVKPILDYNFESRDQNLEAALLKSEMHFLLITPSLYLDKDKLWYLTAPIAFLKSATDETIEKFMLASNWPVEERAKHAAIYEFGKDLLYNWQTHKTYFGNKNKKLMN